MRSFLTTGELADEILALVELGDAACWVVWWTGERSSKVDSRRSEAMVAVSRILFSL